MELTARHLNRATLDRQLLLRREDTDVVDAVRRVLALQAQEPASPYLALWNRVSGFDPSELDRAFRERRIVKTPLMRITLHAICRDDYPSFRDAVGPILRAARLNDRRFRETGMTTTEADALVDGLVAFAATPRSSAEILAHLGSTLGAEPPEHLWWALRTYAPLTHAPADETWSFARRPVFEAAPDEPAPSRPGLDELIHRYLTGFGPATAEDIAQFTLLPLGAIRPTLGRMAAELVDHVGPDGRIAYDVADARPIPAPDTPAPARLLGMWDSVLLAYRDRGRVLPDGCRKQVIRRNGDVLPTVLVDGYVAGVWRPLDGAIEITPFEPIAEEHLGALDGEARELLALLAERDPGVYSRFGRWWNELPAAGRTTIGG